MSESGFNVHVPSGFSNPDVQNLSQTEKSMAGAMGWSDEEFRRSKIEHLAKEERRRERGRELGETVERFLGELGPGYRLRSVTWNADSLTWRLEIQTPTGTENVVLSWELVDDVLDARTRSEFQRLRNMVFFGLGRRDVIFGNRK
jgi:hypothetical protein